MNIKQKLEFQLREIEERFGNCEDFKEWAMLQVAKSNILSALQKYEGEK